MKKKTISKNPRGAGRPAKGYERLVLRTPPGTTATLHARRQPRETPGECLARLLGGK